ncbi:hypothetical protein NDN01_12930 [Sphingomonas sp. QA11]|uniref:hypothetical protein n=1 Tax=Sphingomonas sp. QA11 TaxID=2950605 RepID=UPI00234B1187|nr:hypothetical protein [Sphingomonas sp. QA11]WCM24995.1 hypothetical protein NDN01_12930 [Sphingomonas sp. QA11]
MLEVDAISGVTQCEQDGAAENYHEDHDCYQWARKGSRGFCWSIHLSNVNEGQVQRNPVQLAQGKVWAHPAGQLALPNPTGPLSDAALVVRVAERQKWRIGNCQLLGRCDFIPVEE